MTNSSVLTIFGATGDLVRKKILPSLYSLYKSKELPENLKVVGYARRDFTGDKYNKFIDESLNKYLNIGTVDAKFYDLFEYVQGDLEEEAGYKKLEEVIKKYDTMCGENCIKLFYFSIQPSFYETVASKIAEFEFNNNGYRLLIEKPYGHDEQSAKNLDSRIKQYFSEDQIYRIDHYLHKKIVREIPEFRFGHSIIKSSWQPSEIKKIVISTKEDFGVEDRGAFYDALGTLRDVGQNHLLAIASLIIMDEYDLNKPEDFLEKRTEALKNIKILEEDEEIKNNTFRAQYEGYLNIENVEKDSKTETYFKARLFSSKEGWQEIPFILDAGKKLDEHKNVVKVYFETNVIFFEMYPNLEICIGKYDENSEQCLMKMDTEMSEHQYVEEYASVIKESIEGKRDYFVCIDEVLHQWKIVDAIVKAWHNNVVPLETYKPGTTPESNIN
ncbi:hypothetical protein KC678_01865 [Candidatus Dojkabacteria bacterium]|uniref:Glucose-6-phosphate dehydrogenase (NADP(+)) n=1 Tax=Candidatus Dojkabacteria bacterium TaxID=2099670 RepID=A0A955I8Q2_9BACT|nr:hypothetical protein [Candidatus Dojkabacteria bacterium]